MKPLKQFTLRRMLTVYSLLLFAIISFLLLVTYIGVTAGARHQLYSFANSQELQVQRLQQRIVASQDFKSTWIPEGIGYLQLSPTHHLIQTNLLPSQQQAALAFLAGSTDHSQGYFQQVTYPQGVIVLHYQIGVRYSSAWANTYLPNLEIIILLILALSVFVPTLWFTHTISKRMRSTIAPLQQAIINIGKGDLNIPVPSLAIIELQELAKLTERMRIELKATLEQLWANEHQLKEQTTQMLHDYRSPLTVARANAEFLQQDLAQLTAVVTNDEHASEAISRETLLQYAQSLNISLQRLGDVADHLQQQLQAASPSSLASTTCAAANPSLTLPELHQQLAKTAASLCQYYQHNLQCDVPILPPTASQLTTVIDAKAILQALTNIIVNACEHGAAPQTISIHGQCMMTALVYTISNSGSQFSPSALQHATTKGFSEKNTTGAQSSAPHGLGLYFVEQLVTTHGGKIQLSNNSAGHATVELTIPVV